MNQNREVEQYLREVLRNVQAPPRERARIEADLRAHIEEGLAAGEPAAVLITRLGPPTEVAAEFMSNLTLHYAGFLRRLVAFAIDIALCGLVITPLAAVTTILSNLVPQQPQGSDYLIGGILIVVIISLGLVIAGIFLLYFPVLEGRFGQTAGKRLLGLHVIKETGAPIGFKEAFLRRLSFYFDFLVVDAVFIFFTAKRQRVFDIIARTVVIRERD